MNATLRWYYIDEVASDISSASFGAIAGECQSARCALSGRCAFRRSLSIKFEADAMQASRPEIVLWIMFVDNLLIQYQSGSHPYEDWNMRRAYGNFLNVRPRVTSKGNL